MLLLSPRYPWYSLLVIALVALDGRWEWLTVTLAGTTLYLAGRLLPGFPLQAWTYGVAALVVTAGACLRCPPVRELAKRCRGPAAFAKGPGD
jgi:hypothetical protein